MSVDWLCAVIKRSPWFLRVLRAARTVDVPEWWVGGGALRDLVWDTQAGQFDPARVKDVDLAFFDPTNLRRSRDQQVEAALRAEAPDIVWDAKNQAAVHTWYADRFGVDVDPLASAADGVATWPKTATAVAVRLAQDDQLVVTAPCGLDDLRDGIWRRNPRRVLVEEYTLRVQRKQITRRWPHVRVIPEPAPPSVSPSTM